MKKFLSIVTVLIFTVWSYSQTIDINGATTPVPFVYNQTLNSNTQPTYPVSYTDSIINVYVGDTLTNITDQWGFVPTAAGGKMKLWDVNFNQILFNGLTNGVDTVFTNMLQSGTSYMIRFVTNNGTQWALMNMYNPSASTNEYAFDPTAMVVYPSPATSSTTIRFFAEKTDVPVYIFTLNGAMVFSDNKTRMVGSLNEIEVDLSKFEKGTYLVKSGELVKKLIVE